MAATVTETLTLGHSPDPDDAFMFYAMAANKIDLRGYRFKHQLEDIQTLNERAMRGELHISAVSIHAYAYVSDKYLLLPCGASMGDGYGPLVIEKHRTPNAEHRTSSEEERERLRNCLIAVPGTMTSAFLALKLYLGEWWKNRTGLPLPLGGNVLRRDIPLEIQSELSAILRQSIEFGLAHRAEAVQHSMPYARDMGSDLASKFIGMYVNEFTRDYGEVGREAIRRFLREAREHGYVDREVSIDFVK